MLGRARRIVVTKDDTTIVDGAGVRRTTSRAGSTRSRPRSSTPTPTGTARSSRSAWRSWPAACALIKVGAHTEVELKEKKHRIEDAVSATRAAIEEGIVPGGGVALIRAEAAVDPDALGLEGDVAIGATIVRKALSEPVRLIAENAGHPGAVIVEHIRSAKGGNGFNAATGEYMDLVKAGVIDPAKVTRSALQNAASIAALVLTTEALGGREARGGGARGRRPRARALANANEKVRTDEGRGAMSSRPSSRSYGHRLDRALRAPLRSKSRSNVITLPPLRSQHATTIASAVPRGRSAYRRTNARMRTTSSSPRSRVYRPASMSSRNVSIATGGRRASTR